MIGSPKPESLVLGGPARADLLPPEVRARRRIRELRRRLGLAVPLVLVLVLVLVGLVTVRAMHAQSALTAEQDRTQSILVEQRKYIAVRSIQDQLAQLRAAQKVGASTEIDWTRYLNGVQSTLPTSVTLDTVSIDSASPLEPYAQATAPLQGARVATLSFTATSPTLPRIPAWLDALMTLPGYVDASPGSVTRVAGGYSVVITMHINQDAYAHRFETPATDAATGAGATSTGSTSTEVK